MSVFKGLGLTSAPNDYPSIQTPRYSEPSAPEFTEEEATRDENGTLTHIRGIACRPDGTLWVALTPENYQKYVGAPPFNKYQLEWIQKMIDESIGGK